MSADCCGHNATFEGLSADYKRRLWAVIAINATMFLVEMGAGALAGSQALQADALDFLGDSLTYGISLAVIGAALRVRAWTAFEMGAPGSRPGLDPARAFTIQIWPSTQDIEEVDTDPPLDATGLLQVPVILDSANGRGPPRP